VILLVLVTSVFLVRGHTRSTARCPVGTGNSAVEWSPFIQFGGQTYTAGPGRPELGRIVSHIQCTLGSHGDPESYPTPFPDDTAPYLKVGTAVYEVKGYPRS